MTTNEDSLSRLEKGLGDANDLERLENFVRRSAYFLGKLPGYDTGPLSSPNLYSLVHAVTEIASGFDPAQIAQITIVKMAEFVPMDYCALYLWNREARQLHCSARKFFSDTACQDPFGQLIDLNSTAFLLPVLTDSRPMLLSKVDSSYKADQQAFFEHSLAETALLLPVQIRNQVNGLVIILNGKTARPVGPHEVVLLRMLANQAGASIENADLYQNSRQRTLELEALWQASLAVTASLDIERVLNAILESIQQLLDDLHDAHIFLYDGQNLTFGAARFIDGTSNEPFAIPRQDGLTYTVARTGQLVEVPDMRSHPLYQHTPPDWRGSIVGMPLKIGARVVGVLTASRARPGNFLDHELRVMRLIGDQAALAIENARLHSVISLQAITDSLTGLPNRRFYDQRLQDEFVRSSRYGHHFCVVILDLDHFKQINDTFGHPFGDLVLQRFSDAIRRSLHNTDILARYGGDEFALILPETNRGGVTAMIKRLKKVTRGLHLDTPLGTILALDVSAGFAVYPDDTDTLEDLFSKADQDLYNHKYKTD